MIFVDESEIDTWWTTIKEATQNGRLGDASKVSTARPNPSASNPNQRVMIVYTYDWTDEMDVMRVREELRKLGVTWKIPSKSDEDTMSGKYRVRGDTRISKYYC